MTTTNVIKIVSSENRVIKVIAPESTITKVVAQGPQGPATPYEEVTGTAGQDISALRIVGMFGASWRYVSASNREHRNMGLGMSKTSTLSGGPLSIITAGVFTDTAWNWDAAKPIFLGENGMLTQTPPTTGFCQIVGHPMGVQGIKISIHAAIERT